MKFLKDIYIDVLAASNTGCYIQLAAKIGTSIEDLVIDPLVLSVSSDIKAALVTLQTVDLLSKSFGVNINLDASNVLFDLPDRPSIKMTFPTLAIQMGATCSITDPAKLGMTVRATDMLLRRDDNSLRYLKYFRTVEKLREKEVQKALN